MVWAANGLPFDLLTAAGLIGHRMASGAIVLSSVYWPGAAVHLEACPDCREDYVGLRDLVLAEAKWPANPG
jgi:hypothetical protein